MSKVNLNESTCERQADDFEFEYAQRVKYFQS